ncbi:glycosyltransferase [Reichenbachiella ulvae]|uniref:Glycosyltransferase n=1 Tax=Reichenbachiella ulvae TaxID=2980104 RepID=A0ABT3CYW0_9BACT|nr:glycosyltransferase [Reichenbachiella ulvae]MCV9388807.1 glycosyltransferase [Reichenbachiella ulvae]
MKILHITSWYPTRKNPKSALWVERHIEALASAGDENKVYHLELNKGRFELSLGKTELRGNKKYCLISSFAPWFAMELVAILFLSWILWKERKQQYDIINFHIAYPNLTYWHWIKRWIKTPVVITEHWSAYHDNFGLASADQLPRIQRIFRQKIPVIAVSQALLNDIKTFSYSNFPSFVVPNVVDTQVFHYQNEVQPQAHRFFMVSQWKYPKDPFSVIRNFAAYSQVHPEAELRIGGYGPQIEKMKKLIISLSLQEHTQLLGSLNSDEIALEMNQASALVHLSNYETFSVVCAEAICCGCPVIASDIGGIPEFINESNGYLIKDKDQLLNSMKLINHTYFNRELISNTLQLDKSSIGERYSKILKLLSNNHK